MRSSNSYSRYLAGVCCAVSVFIVTIGVAAPPGAQTTPRQQGPLSKIDVAPTTLDVSRAFTKDGLRSGATAQPNERLSGLELEVRPPERADYRESAAPVLKTQFGVTAVGPRKAFSADGAIAGPGTCAVNDQCQDCTLCTTNECVDNVCESTDDTGNAPQGCDDGLACNGLETCEAGVCTEGTPVDCGNGQYCVNSPDLGGPSSCVADCNGDGDCDDSLGCTTDTCVDGVCEHSSKCGPGALADCVEPDGDCPLGRCCTGGNCSAVDWATCGGEGSDWLATDDDACVEIEPSGNLNDCPEYASGISPQGTYLVKDQPVGPISNLACDSIIDVGDDYQTAGWPEQEYFDVAFLRFAGGTVPDSSARFSIAFHDKDGNFIENVFWPDGQGLNSGSHDTVFAIQTVDFDPPLRIPTKGYVVWTVQNNFTPDGRVELLATDAVDVGGNNPDVMWLNGQPVGAADAGPLAAGARVLAFELIGTDDGSPEGACCTGFETADCIQELPWICEDSTGINGQFQGFGVLCRACVNDVFTTCDVGSDCPDTCDNDTSVDCSPAGGGICVDGGTCVAAPTNQCFSIFPVCQTSACCRADGSCDLVGSTGACDGEFQGFGTLCDPNCCTQLNVTGGDGCDLVTVQSVTIPTVGDPPVFLTMTGNNSAASFVEFGHTTFSGIFNPDGNTLDPGWWEGWELKGDERDCAEVRLSLCCSEAGPGKEPVRPAWAAIWKGCSKDPPFDVTQGNAGVDPPIGIGRGTAGFARGEPFCGEDNLWMTFTNLRPGRYYYPILSFPGSTCDNTSGVGCDYQMQVVVGACPVAACCTGEKCEVTSQVNCLDDNGYWLHDINTGTGTVVNCGSGTPEDPFICLHGACCTGPGQCEDRADGQTECDLEGDPDTCMDKVLCEVLEGAYVGGGLCSNPGPPCPICEIATDTGCTRPDLSSPDWYQMADLSIPPDGNTVADDFVPSSTTITTACAWGMYMDILNNSPDVTQNGSNCEAGVTDDFRIKIYPDVDGRPGPVAVCESKVSDPIRGEVDSQIGVTLSNVQMFEYQLPLDTPCEVLIADDTYWIEIVNNTVEDDRCGWRWYNSAAGNLFSANGSNTGGYPLGSERSGPLADQAWCIDQSYSDPAQPLGECCACPDQGGACETTTLGACPNGHWKDVDGDGDPASIPNDLCADAIPITGDTVTIATDTECATTEAPDHGVVGFGCGIWYEYTATCTGKVTVNGCGAGNVNNTYDSAIAVYRNPNNSKVCLCPADGGQLTGGTFNDVDEGCDSVANGGSGILAPPPVLPGDCLLVRMGGFDEDCGRGLFTIGCIESDCPPSLAPEIEILSVNDSDQAINKVRNLAFSVPNSGDRAVRVVLDNLPSPHDVANGLALWVNAPKEVCENSGQGFSIPIEDCGPAPGLPSATYMVATLGCDPVYRDWSGDGVINVYGELVVPNGDYIIQVIDAECPPALEDSFSEPLLYSTSIWGDMLDDCTSTEGITPCGAPDKSVDITADVSACLGKFGNVQHLQASRADIEPGLLDGEVNISDVTFVLNAFASAPYPFAAPVLPCGSVTSSGSD